MYPIVSFDLTENILLFTHDQVQKKFNIHQS
jgi:hypothetical protein